MFEIISSNCLILCIYLFLIKRRCLEELDPVVAALQRELETGKLQQDHIFYKALKNALEFATKIGLPAEQFQHNRTIQLLVKTMNLIMGQKGGGTFSFNWKVWNFPFIPGKTTQAKYKGGYTT